MGVAIIYVDPFRGCLMLMPIDMISAYVPYASHLNLQETARMAHILDVDAANNLLLSMQEKASEGTESRFTCH